MSRPLAADRPAARPAAWEEDQWEDYEQASPEQQNKMIELWGKPF